MTDDNKVASILSRLQDLCIADWAEANEETLLSISFDDFMEKLRGQALEKDWDQKIKLAIIGSKQGERLFNEWAYELKNCNVLLLSERLFKLLNICTSFLNFLFTS